MDRRQLGSNGPMVSAIGLGCMSFAGVFGETDEATSLACLDAAYEAGVTFYDTANIYGMGRSETVLGTWLASRKPDVVLATKGGIVREARRCNNEAAHLQAELEGSLKRLGVDHVPLYYIHRRDPSVPLEDLMETLSRFIQAGKIGGYGLSEVSPATIRRAHALLPCRAVQSEYSLWTRLPELGVIQACAELGIAFVPFSPLARGVLSAAPPKLEALAETDYRRPMPRFQPEAYARNLTAIDALRAMAQARGRHLSELALSWVLAQGAHLLPIPGTRSAAHLGDWVGADADSLSPDDLDEIDRLLPIGFAEGDRYSDEQMKTIERYC